MCSPGTHGLKAAPSTPSFPAHGQRALAQVCLFGVSVFPCLWNKVLPTVLSL